MAPPPPPPPSHDETMMMPDPMMVTPPPKHKTPYGYKRHGPSFSKTATSSPATSHASSCMSPTQLLKARSTGDVVSPRVRGATRMDPYPRYSPRKRLSADFSDGTFSGESCTDSPRSEKGGWRIHAAVQGPFLTGPLAKDFAGRLDELRSPRGKQPDEPDFDNTGLLLFPVVPDFVPPAITPEVFQASIQPTPVVQPQPEPDHSVTPQTDAYYTSNTDQYYAQQQTTSEASWDATTQQQQEQYYYAEQQQYSADQQYYYNNGYDQQYDNTGYSNGEYNYQQTYEQYPATEQSSVQNTEDFSMMSAQNAEAFPPLPSHAIPTPEVETSTQATTDNVSNQQSEPAATASPSSPVGRSRAPSYAEIVTGAAHTTPAVEPEAVEETPKPIEAEVPKTAAKATFATFDQLSDGIAESMSRILAKSNGSKTHAEVEFACLVRRIQTQLKLMGRVSNSLHLKQMKTLHKLQKSEIEKLSIESSNMQLLARVKKYEQEQEELKKQLAVALEAKDVRLRDAVEQLSAKIDSLKNSTDASSSSLASEIDAIRKCSSPDDLEKRVEEIGQVIDYLVDSQNGSSKNGIAPPKRTFETRRQSAGSWKALALYAIIVWAASLCGVWVGVKYAGTVSQAPVVHTPVVQPPVVVESVPAFVEEVAQESVAPFEEVAQKPIPAFEEVTPEPVSEVAEVAEVAEAAQAVEVVEVVTQQSVEVAEEVEEVVVEVEVPPASFDLIEPVFEPLSVVDSVVIDTESAVDEPAVVDTLPETEETKEVVAAPVEATVTEAVVFTFEQMPQPSPSCFTCPSDHSTLASFFCDMLSEVMAGHSTIVEEPFGAVDVVDAAVPESDEEVSMTPVLDDVAVEAVQFESVSENWNAFVAPVEESMPMVKDVVVTEVDVPAEVSSESASEVPVAHMTSSPLTHALYVWCPSLFDMHAEEKDALSAPLSDLARALTSLSSQILSENTHPTVEEVTEEAEVTTFEVVEDEQVVEQVEVVSAESVAEEETEVVAETEHVVVADVDIESASVMEPDEVEKVVEVTPDNRWATEQFLINIGVLSGTAELVIPEASEISEVVVDTDSEVAEATPSSCSVTEQFLINVGVLSGTAEIVIPEASVISEEDVSPVEVTEVVEETPVEVVEEVMPVSFDEVVEVVEVVEETYVEPTVEDEVAPVTTEAVPSVEHVVESCPLERCPLFKEVAIEEIKVANASLIVTEPTFQIAEESIAADEEVEETVGTSPALDLKSLLLTSL